MKVGVLICLVKGSELNLHILFFPTPFFIKGTRTEVLCTSEIP